MPGNLPLSQTEGERERSPLQSKEWETILDAVSHPVEQPVLLTTRELQRYYSFWIPATKEIFFFFELTFQPPVFKLALWGFQEKKKKKANINKGGNAEVCVSLSSKICIVKKKML